MAQAAQIAVGRGGGDDRCSRIMATRWLLAKLLHAAGAGCLIELLVIALLLGC